MRGRRERDKGSTRESSVTDDNSEKKVIDRFKDQLNGNRMVRFVDLKPKQYAFEIEDGEEKKKAKNDKKNVTKTLTVDVYEQTLFHNKTIRREQFMIRSQNPTKHKALTSKKNRPSPSISFAGTWFKHWPLGTTNFKSLHVLSPEIL